MPRSIFLFYRQQYLKYKLYSPIVMFGLSFKAELLVTDITFLNMRMYHYLKYAQYSRAKFYHGANRISFPSIQVVCIPILYLIVVPG